MAAPEDAAFEQFVAQRRKALQRIARHTQGEQQLVDVVNEAWVLAHDLAARKEVALDFLDSVFQELLLSHLYQQLVRYTELNVRHAVRLDHAAAGDHEDEGHPLMRMLVSNEGRDPLAELVQRETEAGHDREINVRYCLASAYVSLLNRFDNKMSAVADYLLISVSHAYRRCAYARLLAVHQMPVPLLRHYERFTPGPWRHFRLRRRPIQLAFDFDDELPLASERQMPSSEGSSETRVTLDPAERGPEPLHSHSIVNSWTRLEGKAPCVQAEDRHDTDRSTVAFESPSQGSLLSISCIDGS